MTDVAQSTMNVTNHHRPMPHSDLPMLPAHPVTAPVAPTHRAEPALDGNQLVLTGSEPHNVNLSVIAGVPVFWQQSSPTQLYTGIAWKPDVYALMITFAFVPPPNVTPTQMVTELVPVTPVLWFSDTFSSTVSNTSSGSSVNSQMCCVPSTLGEYHFDVTISDVVTNQLTRLRSVDPKVVVKPIVT